MVEFTLGQRCRHGRDAQRLLGAEDLVGKVREQCRVGPTAEGHDGRAQCDETFAYGVEFQDILDLNALTFLKTFFARIWGVLWFPVNWSTPLEWWMRLAFVGGIAGSILMLKARPGRRRLAIALGCVAVACVPAHHLLLIDASLERCRYLTLASAPFVLALVFAWTALPRHLGILAAVLLVTFQVAAVDHNLKIWRTVAVDRHDACRDVAALIGKTTAPIAITGMPLLINGVYWSNGFAECLSLDYRIPPGRVRVNGARPTPGEQELPWATFRQSRP